MQHVGVCNAARQICQRNVASTLETLGSEGNNDLRGASLAATSSACEVCPLVGFAIGFVAGAGEAVATLLTCLQTNGRLSLMTG